MARRAPSVRPPDSAGSGGGIAALVFVLLAVAAPVSAQIPKLVAEGRLGAAIPTGSFADEGATAGPSFGVGFAFAVRGGFYLHLGFSQHRFGCSTCTLGDDPVATGFDIAVRQTWDAGFFLPWIRAAALPYTVEIDGGDTDGGRMVSDHTWGWEAGAGVGLRVSDNVHLSPGIRFLSLRPGFEGVTFDLDAVAVDLGVIWAF